MLNNSRQPKWVTPARQAKLIELFLRSGGFCIFGHKNCLIPEHHYIVFIEALIKDWQTYDRQERAYINRIVAKSLHSLGEQKYPLRGQFSAVSKEVYGTSQPLFYVEGLGMSGVILKPYAKVRLSSSYLRLYIDLGNTLRGVSKSKRRKAIRYGKPLPVSIENRISMLIGEAVKDYLTT